jgi:hypothetical protein
MDYLDMVAVEDVQQLRKKEQTYQGSWKKRGGIGTFMMLARKWDRLESMAQSRGWDVFKDPGDGSDGTPLAEIRDLRRYLLLVEAELKSRSAVTVTMTNDPGLFSPVFIGPGTPEDGRHHAQQPAEYERCVPRMLPSSTLDDGLQEQDIDPDDRGCYITPKAGSPFIVNRFEVSPSRWEHLPRLFMELNHKEWEETPVHYQCLYLWDNSGGNKWTMQKQYREHWGRYA